MNESVINIGIFVTYGLIGLAAALVILSAIYRLVVNFKKAKNGLIGLAVLLVVLLIGYLLSTNEVYDGIGPNVSQLIGGGITATMILIGLGLVAAVFTEIYKLIR